MASESEKPFSPMFLSALARRRYFPEHAMSRKADPDQALLDKLLKAGVTARTIEERWGVTFWSLRMKEDGVKVKVDTSHNPGFDPNAFTRWLSDLLKPYGPVILKEKPIRKCCDSRCRGCLCGNPESRAVWFSS